MTIVERAMADAAEQGRSEDEGWADGMGLLRQIASNAGCSPTPARRVPGLISSGDVAAGMAIDFHSLDQIESSPRGRQRSGWLRRARRTRRSSTPTRSPVAKAPSIAETAMRFIEFVLSEDGQRLWYTPAGASPAGRSDVAPVPVADHGLAVRDRPDDLRTR